MLTIDYNTCTTENHSDSCKTNSLSFTVKTFNVSDSIIY